MRRRVGYGGSFSIYNMELDCANTPVMKAHCKTCPFKIVDGKRLDAELASAVTERTLFKAHQLCHGTNNKTRCKGSFDFNFTIYERMGVSHLVAL